MCAWHLCLGRFSVRHFLISSCTVAKSFKSPRLDEAGAAARDPRVLLADHLLEGLHELRPHVLDEELADPHFRALVVAPLVPRVSMARRSAECILLFPADATCEQSRIAVVPWLVFQGWHFEHDMGDLMR